MRQPPPPDRCPQHKPINPNYLAVMEDAERRRKRGERQARCAKCRRWLWADEMGETPREAADRVTRIGQDAGLDD